MPWQLIYTSSPRTLAAGQSGYGTVARSRDLREALAQRLEQFSYYAHTTGLRPEVKEPAPIVFAYRILDFRGSRYHVLTRVQDAGLDFTNRTNHLAHHLVFEPAELAALPPPPVILDQWNGWCRVWQQEPALLGEEDWGSLYHLPRSVPLPATNWHQVTGDAGSAAALLGRGFATGCTLSCPLAAASTLLSLFAESLQLLDPTGRQPIRLWEYPFTTYLQAEDNPADFRWRVCLEGTPAWFAVQRGTEPALSPLSELTAPESPLTQLARLGTPKPATPSPAPSAAGHPPRATAAPQWLIPPPPSPRAPKTPAMSRRKPPVGRRRPEQPGGRTHADLGSPRVWIPALALLVLLALGFVFGRPRHPKAASADPQSASSVTLPESANSSTSVISPNPDSLLSDVSQNPEPKLEKSVSPRLPQPPSKEALNVLALQTDWVPTWIIPLESESPVLLPPIKELEELLRQVFLAERPLPLTAADCWLTAKRLDLSSGAGITAQIREESDPRGLSVRLPAGPGIQIDCNAWLADKGMGRAMVLVGQNLHEAGVLIARIQSSVEPAAFPPFRLVLFGGPRFEPLRLSKTLLLSDARSFEAYLHPELHNWLAAFHLADAKASWQLRPSTANSPETDLFQNLSEAFLPGLNHALDFDLIREKIHKPLLLDREKLAKLSKSVDDFQASLQQDLPLGEVLGHYTNELSSLATFAKARNRKLDRNTYLAYLRELIGNLEPRLLPRLPLPGASEEDTRVVLSSLRAYLELSPALANHLKPVPAGYFERRWDLLGNAPEMMRKASELDSVRKSIARYERFLTLVPADLPSTPRVSLVLVSGGGKRFEVVRFEDPPFHEPH